MFKERLNNIQLYTDRMFVSTVGMLFNSTTWFCIWSCQNMIGHVDADNNIVS